MVNNYKAESLLIAENSLDYVVSTLVCCSVKDLQGSLNEINRVLKPGGRYIFMEHVAANDGSRCRRWQNRINPFWKRMAGNCHLYPCSLEMQDFRVSVENQVKASLEGNDGSFTRAITQDWVSTEAPVGQA
ncbi:MAG TPA: class I SAM-dependent methyltransferase [Aeromonadales bacterium]|nr:class I SAM-dependent methyltransferase [Aeromonadales bacterium]